MQDQLRALGGSVSSEHTLSAQINDLREVRATIRERLQATESSLADARQEVVALRLKDQEQSRKIVALETVAARTQSQPAEASQILLRIQEVDSRNRVLQSEIVTLRKEVTDLSGQLRQSSTDARELTEHLATTQQQLEAACEETTRLREEKSTSERQAMFQREQLRKELSTAANMQLASMQSEHMNVVQQLKLKISPAEEKLKNVNRHINMLKAEKERSESESAQLQTLLKGAQTEKEKSDRETAQLQTLLREAQTEKQAIIGTRKALQLHIKEMEVSMYDKNNQCRDSQAMLNKANDQVRAKDLEIMALKASQASIDQSLCVGPTKSKSSRHLTNLPAVVEDSQPTEKPTSVGLDDLMLEDPFAGYAQEGSQTIAGEDISHLFPSTPGAGSRAKDLDYSQNSVSHTTVISETRRRQHQSFREAKPHIGALTSNKSHSRSHPKVTHNYAVPRPSAPTSPTKVSSRRSNISIPDSHREASVTRESTQPQGSVKDPRRGKRNSVAAGFNDTNARPGKVPKAEPPKQSKALGPIIEDSQSPLLNGRSRKMTRRKPSAPKGKHPSNHPKLWDYAKITRTR